MLEYEEEEDENKESKSKKSSDDDEVEAVAEELFVNEKRGYTSKEKDMIAEWLKKNKPKTDEIETEEK